MGKSEYVSPQVEIIEIEMEKGFAASGEHNGIDGWDQGVF